MKTMEARRAELYVSIAEWSAETARAHGVDASVAEQVANAVVDRFIEEVGGEVLSFPKDSAYKLSLRDREILHAHREGATLPELKDRYGMTERGLRKLLKRAILRDRSDRERWFNQQALPLGD